MSVRDRALAPKEVQEHLGISPGTFHNLMNNDPDFKTFLVGRHRKMLESDLKTWIEKQKQKEEVAA